MFKKAFASAALMSAANALTLESAVTAPEDRYFYADFRSCNGYFDFMGKIVGRELEDDTSGATIDIELRRLTQDFEGTITVELMTTKGTDARYKTSSCRLTGVPTVLNATLF